MIILSFVDFVLLLFLFIYFFFDYFLLIISDIVVFYIVQHWSVLELLYK